MQNFDSVGATHIESSAGTRRKGVIGRLRCRWEGNFKTNLKAIGCKDVEFQVWLRTEIISGML
jgi:hypothetical protein